MELPNYSNYVQNQNILETNFKCWLHLLVLNLIAIIKCDWFIKDKLILIEQYDYFKTCFCLEIKQV